MWTIDLTQEGIYAIWTVWQAMLIEWILLKEKMDQFLVREAYEYLRKDAKLKISRASVIQFLKKLDDWGFLRHVNTTGKGGFRPSYYRVWSSEDIAFDLLAAITLKFRQAFPYEPQVREVFDYVINKRKD